MLPETPSHQMSAQRRRVYEVLCTVSDVQRRSEMDLETALLEITTAAARSVPGAQYAGVTLVDADGRMRSLAPTHQHARTLDDLQRDTGEGPCLSAARADDIIVIDDLRSETRWPRYRRCALDRTPVRSILSVRLHNVSKGLAALNFSAASPGVFDDESIELATVFAAHTAIAWNIVHRHQQFQNALMSRDIIGQAKGMLMERFGVDAAQAFELLRRLSQESNIRLVEVAERIVATEQSRTSNAHEPTPRV